MKPAGRRPEAMQQPTDDADEVQLEVAYFELVDAGPPLTLLRLGGHWAGVDPADLPAPTLVLRGRRGRAPPAAAAGGAQRRTGRGRAVLARGVRGAGRPGGRPVDELRARRRAGGTSLPHPFERHLADEHAAPEAGADARRAGRPGACRARRGAGAGRGRPRWSGADRPRREPAAAAASAEPAGAARPQPTPTTRRPAARRRPRRRPAPGARRDRRRDVGRRRWGGRRRSGCHEHRRWRRQAGDAHARAGRRSGRRRGRRPDHP